MQHTTAPTPRVGKVRYWIFAALVVATVFGALGWAEAHGTNTMGPLTSALLPAPIGFEGRVAERLAVGSYAYLRVEREGAADAWVVAMRPRANVGDRVQISAVGRAENFDSKRLGRRFDELWFAVVRTTD